MILTIVQASVLFGFPGILFNALAVVLLESVPFLLGFRVRSVVCVRTGALSRALRVQWNLVLPIGSVVVPFWDYFIGS